MSSIWGGVVDIGYHMGGGAGADPEKKLTVDNLKF